MFDEFIRRLREDGQRGETCRTALVLPSPYLLERARVELRKTEATAWEFPRILSLDELAAMLSGLRKISRVEQEMLLEEIVGEAAAGELCRCFCSIADFPGFIAALARLFDEFKMAAVTPDELEGALEALSDEVKRNGDRDRAIAGLFRLYQNKLSEASLVDVAGTYLLAVETAEQPEAVLPFERVFMAEFSVLSPMRLRLVESLQKRVPMEIGICFEKNRPEIFSAVEPVYQTLVGMNFIPRFCGGQPDVSSSLKHLRRQLFQDEPLVESDASGIHVLLCPNMAKQISVVADQIKTVLLSTEYRPEDVAIVVRNLEDYYPVRKIFDDRGIPVDSSHSVALTELALPRLVFAWLEMLRGRGSRACVMEVIKSPYVGVKLGWNPDLLEKSLLGAVIRDWNDWDEAINRQAPDENRANEWRKGLSELRSQVLKWTDEATWQGRASELRELMQWLGIPSLLQSKRSDGLIDLMEVRAEMEAMSALLAAADELEEISGILIAKNTGITVGTFAALLRRILQGARVNLSDRRDTGVQVVTPGTASGMRYPLVFVLGLTEGEFPAPAKESWLYGDEERRSLGEAGIILSTAEGRTATEDFYFSLAVGMATEKLYLSAVTDGETLPSRYVEEVTRLFAGGAVSVEAFGPHQIVVEEAGCARSPRELLLGAIRGVWQETATNSKWSEIYSGLVSSLPEGLEKRAVIEQHRSDAHAGAISPDLIESSRFSPSALEQYADCPFAYLVTQVLGLSEWEEATEGLDAMTAGSLWHEILAAFLAKYRNQRLLQPRVEVYQAELERLLDNAVWRRESQGRIVPGVWWRFEKPRWKIALRQWLEGELVRQSGSVAAPSFFEWSFGMALRTGCDGASTEVPLLLGKDELEVTLQGKVDRIDTGGGLYRVIDYKTGRAPTRKQVEMGLRLQVPVYMMAVEALLDGAAEMSGEGGYLPVGRSSPGLELPGKKMTRGELFAATEKFVTSYAAGIRAGLFPASPALECPDYCVARSFCRMTGEADNEGAEETQDE